MAKEMKAPVIMFEYFFPCGMLSKELLKDRKELDEKLINWWELVESKYELLVEIVDPCINLPKYEVSFYGPIEDDLISAGHDLIKICGMPPYISSSKKDLASRLVQSYGKKLKSHTNPAHGLKIVDA